MRHIWSVLCSKSVVDKKSNNISLFDIMEEIHFSSEKPAVEGGVIVEAGPVPAHWVSLFGRSNIEKPEKVAIKDTIITPSGKIIGEYESEVDLSANKRRRIIRTVPVPPSMEEGLFIFETKMKEKESWKRISEITLELIPAEKRQTEQK